MKQKPHEEISRSITILAALAMTAPVLAFEDVGEPDLKVIEGVYPGKTYSPYAQRNFPSRVYWGETHLHTGLSLDAGLFGNILGPEDAYRFARGEEIKSSTGLPVKLGRPLDWMAVTDHTDAMGLATDIQTGQCQVLRLNKSSIERNRYSVRCGVITVMNPPMGL
jgi:hypothetical protein